MSPKCHLLRCTSAKNAGFLRFTLTSYRKKTAKNRLGSIQVLVPVKGVEVQILSSALIRRTAF